MSNKIAVVTGAGSGIGRATALGLLKNDFTVVLAGRRETELRRTADLSGSQKAVVWPTDVSRPESVRALFAHIKETFGRVDLLFNNAGVTSAPVPFEEIAPESWETVVSINLTGVFLCAQEAFKLMKEQIPNGGRIINNGSISAYRPRPNSAPYTATKHAVTGLTKCISLDGRAYDIACGQIDIGNATTDMTTAMNIGVLQTDGSLRVEPRMDVGHVVDAVIYMANLPLDTNVQFMTVMASKMPFIGRG